MISVARPSPYPCELRERVGAVVVAAASGAGTLAAMAIPVPGMLMAVIGLGAAARHPRR
jgi:hypothetical protein